MITRCMNEMIVCLMLEMEVWDVNAMTSLSKHQHDMFIFTITSRRRSVHAGDCNEPSWILSRIDQLVARYARKVMADFWTVQKSSGALPSLAGI